MHKTPEIDTYNHIATGYLACIEAGDYLGAININANAIAYLATLKPNTRMYGDNFGWITAGELYASANKREAWLKAMADMPQNMRIN